MSRRHSTPSSGSRSPTGRPTDEIAAQAERVAARHRELGEARTEARDLDATADLEQAEADRAARNLQDAESGTPRKDRLG